MNIGLISYGIDWQSGGIGRYSVELRGALKHTEVRATVLQAGATKATEYSAGCPGARLLPGLLTLGQLEIAWIVRKLKLDLVHDPTGAMPLLLARCKRVSTIHDVVPYVYPETSTRLDWLIYRIWLPFAVRRLDAIITDSEASKRDIVRYLPVSTEKVVVIPIAASVYYEPLESEEIKSALERYKVDSPYILYVGSLESRKNLPRLLEAFARLRSLSTDWKLVIVGARKWKYAPIFETVRRLQLEPHVHFTGFVEEEDLLAIYNAADLLVFPSLYEGFGLPVLEAMACGTPVVTSSSSSLPEVAGDAAILVDPYDVEQIAHAMWMVLTQPALAAAMREKGIAWAAQFSWKRTAGETIAVYERVPAERGR